MLAGQRKLVGVRVLAAALFAFLLFGAVEDKLRLIQSGHPPAGTRIVLSPGEIRQWLHNDEAFWAKWGVTNIRLDLGTGRATAFADIDFLKARKTATGQDSNWLLRNLFSGKKPIAVTARFASMGGRGRVDIERLEVNRIPIQGPALELLMEDFVRPHFPEAKVGEWFRMDYRVESFSVAPTGVAIRIGK
jgi:hypothetical protein